MTSQILTTYQSLNSEKMFRFDCQVDSQTSSTNAVVVNSLIYAKPSFCAIAITIGSSVEEEEDVEQSVALMARFNKLIVKEIYNKENNDTQLYMLCTTMNGTIQHKISELSNNAIASINLLQDSDEEMQNDNAKESDNEDTEDTGIDDDDDDSFIEFLYDDNKDEKDNSIGTLNKMKYTKESSFGNNEFDTSDEELDKMNCVDCFYDDKDEVDFVMKPSSTISFISNLTYNKNKKVRFSLKPVVHVMHVWNYAYRASRKGPWEIFVRDRERFRMRIQRTSVHLNTILQPKHRQYIFERYFQHS